MNKIFTIEIYSNRVFGLDILRAAAILFVVIGHGSLLLSEELRVLCNYFFFDRVSIFFVLSGFLIGGILIKLIEKNGFSLTILKSFWIRRWFRTLPNYFLILIVLCIIQFLFIDDLHLEIYINILFFLKIYFRNTRIFVQKPGV
jgi:peptidoglycan/LPS O-acetylase OafA/YrhL